MSLLSLSPSPFSSSPLHGFRLPKSSSGRSGGCGEADWAAFFQPMTDECEQAEQTPAERSRQQPQQQLAPAPSSLPFLSALDGSSPPLVSPGKAFAFSPLESLQSSSPLFSSPSPQPLQPSSSLTASLSLRRQDAPLSARRADGAAASSASLAASASTSCPTASFAPPAISTAPAASSPSAAARSSALAEAQRSREASAAASRAATLSAPAVSAAASAASAAPLSSSSPSSQSPHCALSDMSNDHYLTFEVLSLDSMTGCIGSEDHPFAPSTSAVFDFVSLHAPLQDAANAANAAAAAAAPAASPSCLLQLCDDEAAGELSSSRPTTPSTPEDADAEDEEQQQQQQCEVRLLSPAAPAFFSSSIETQQQLSHPSLTGGFGSFPYATEHRSQRLDAAVAAASTRAGGGEWRQQRYQQFAPQQQQLVLAASPPVSFYAPGAPSLAAGEDGMETDCGLSCAALDAMLCSEAAGEQVDDEAAAAGSRVPELQLARSRTTADGPDSAARRRQQQPQSQAQRLQQPHQHQHALGRQPLSPRSFRRFSFPVLRPVVSAAASSSCSASSSSLFPPPLSPSSRTSSASSPLPRSLGSEEDGSSLGSSGVSSLLPTPSHSPLPVMAASITAASVMAHQITPVTAMRVLPAAATVTAAAAVPELPVTARAIASSPQQQQQPAIAATPHQGSPTPATALSSAGSSLKAVGSVVGTVIAEAALASVASVSSPVMAALPSTAPQMATATFSGAAAASASAACSPVVPAHTVAVVPVASLPSLALPPLPASSSPVHIARIVGSAGLHPRQAFTLPHSKKPRTARHPQPQHQQPVQAASAAAASAAPLLAASCLSLHPPAAPVPANALDGRFWKSGR